MLSLSYLFEGKVLEYLKRNKGKYTLGTAAAGLYYSDDITPDSVKNVIRRVVTGKETINTPEDLLRGYEGHPKYHELKKIASEIDPKDLNRLTKFGIHTKDDLPIPPNSNVPPGTPKENIGGYYRHKVLFPNFRDRELRIRDDQPDFPIEKAFKHELGHHIDLNKNTFSKTASDMNVPYAAQKREYIARKFAKEFDPSKESARDFIKRVREEANRMSNYERSKYDSPNESDNWIWKRFMK